MLAAICSIVKLIPWNEVNLINLYVVVHLFHSWLVWGRNKVYWSCYFAQTAHKLVYTTYINQQSRQQALRAYCSNIYTVFQGTIFYWSCYSWYVVWHKWLWWNFQLLGTITLFNLWQRLPNMGIRPTIWFTKLFLYFVTYRCGMLYVENFLKESF